MNLGELTGSTTPHIPTLGADPRPPERPEHLVQFYEADSFLLKSLVDFVGSGLNAGDACLILATEPHRIGLEAGLEAAGVDIYVAADQGRYLALDARELLSRVMGDGVINSVAFTSGVGTLVRRMIDRFSTVRVFGELVALLCEDGNHSAAVELEQQWNALQLTCSFTLFCAYPITAFQGATLASSLAAVCDQHGHVIPGESFTQLEGDENQLRAVAQLQQVAVSLDAEQKRREAALTRSIRQRDEFLSAVSHDLKTPITILQGQAQLLQRRVAEGAADPESLLRGLKQIENRSRMMARLVDEMLDVAHLRSGEILRLDRTACDLVSVVDEAIRSQSRSANGSRITMMCAEREIDGSWDRKRLIRVVENLIENAVKHGPEGGDVDVTLTRESDGKLETATIRVHDQGAGIPEADVPHVFDYQYRGTNVARESVGPGLGLAGARRIIEQHGGVIGVASRQGQGTTFTVRLPVD